MKVDALTKWQKVHVFVSSTFNDMHAERDYLVKKVFPELQEWCERRKLQLVDIDLRWGVTEQDATHNKNAVKVCLERIDDCRPFFLCFVGQRRGWVPGGHEVSAETYSNFPELRNHVGQASITELEILHAVTKPLHRGVQYDPRKSEEKYEKVQHAFFYLRDDSYLDALPVDPPLLRETYTNEGIEDTGERRHHDEAVKRWRAEVEKTGHPCRRYTAEWDQQATTPEIVLPLQCPSSDPENIERWRRQWAKAGLEVKGESVADDPVLADEAKAFNALLSRGRLTRFESAGEELKSVILRDLKEAIRQRFPDHLEAEEQGDLQRELDQQEEFLRINSEGFIEREGAFHELDRYLADDSRKLFVLTAPGGMGKSMLIANWIDRCTERLEAGQTLHFRFVGQSDRSTTLASLLRFLMLELQQAAGKIPNIKTETEKDPEGNAITREVPFEIPRDPIEVQNLWNEQLDLIGKHGKTILIIDAINELDTGLSDLVWLPLYGLPKDIKFVVSFRDDAEGARDLIQRLGGNKDDIHIAWVKPFHDLDDRRKLVNVYLSQYLKDIDTHHLEEIIRLQGAQSPLFLKVVLTELRVFGSFASLANKIRSDFGVSSLSAFDGVLRRLEREPSHAVIPPSNAVPLLFGLLAHARFGLSAEELAECLLQSVEMPQMPDKDAAALDTAHLLLRQVRPLLARRDGRFYFFYETFRNAVIKRYVQQVSTVSSNRRTAQEWHRLLARYFSAPPMWEDRKAFKPNTRKVAELPYHQTMAEMWDEVEGTLCDLCFVEAKCAAGQVFELLADYQLALKNLPEARAGLQERRERQEPRERWTREIIAYARAWNERRDRIAKRLPVDRIEPALPTPPDSCRIWTDEEVEAECRKIIASPTRLDRFIAFSSFASAECYPLREFGNCPGFALNHAYNHDPAGPVHSAAEGLLLGCSAPALLRNFPPDVAHNPKPALQWTMSGHCGVTAEVRVTTDGRRVVSGSWDKTIRVWDLDSGRLIRTLRGHSHYINGLSIIPDGKYVLSGGWDRMLRLWDLETGKCLKAFKGHQGGIDAVCITPDGRRAISADRNNTICHWNLETGLLGTFEHRNVRTVTITPDGRRAVSGGDDQKVRVWDLDSGRCLKVLGGHKGSVWSISMTPDGRWAVSGSHDGTIHVWDLEGGKCLKSLLSLGGVWSLSVTPDGRWAVSGGNDNTVRVWDLESGRSLSNCEGHSGHIDYLAILPDGDRSVSGGPDGTLRIWDLKNERCLKTLYGHTEPVAFLTMSSDGGFAVSWGNNLLDGVKVWDIGAMACVNIYGWVSPDYGGGNIHTVIMTPDGQRAVLPYGGEAVAEVWDLLNGKYVNTLQGHIAAVDSLAMTPDGHVVLTGSSDSTIRVWDLESGQCLKVLEGHASPVTALCVTPNGGCLISADNNGAIRVWDMESGRCLNSYAGHSGSVLGVSVTPDGRRILSRGTDGTLRVWDFESGQCLKILAGHTGYVLRVDVTPDCKHAISRGGDNTLRVWDLEDGECLSIIYLPTGRSGKATDPACKIDPMCKRVCLGTTTGSVISLTAQNLEPETLVLTPYYKCKSDRRNATAFCLACRKEFALPSAADLALKSRLEISAEDYAPLAEVFDPRLLSYCPHCRHAVRFNPFVVDMSCEHYERVLRRGLKHSLSEKGERHEEVLAYRNALLVQLRSTWVDRCRKVANLMNQSQYSQAEEELQSILELEFEVPWAYCSLSQLYLLTDRDTEARKAADIAWHYQDEAPSNVCACILFCQLALALLDQQANAGSSASWLSRLLPRKTKAAEQTKQISKLLGRLKYALQQEEVNMEWTLRPVVDHINDRLPDEASSLMTVLSSVLDKESLIADLDAFPQWRESQVLPFLFRQNNEVALESPAVQSDKERAGDSKTGGSNCPICGLPFEKGAAYCKYCKFSSGIEI
jgi:WD40 repeat protein